MAVPGRALVLPLGRRDFIGGGRSAVFLVLPPLLARGGPVGVVSLRPCRGLFPDKDGPNRLFAGSVVGGELASGTRLLAP